MGRERLAHALLLALTLVGCDRAPAKESTAAPNSAPSNAPTTIVVPTEGAPIVTPPPSSEPTDTGPGTIGSSVPSTMTEPTTGAATPAPEPTTAVAVPSRKGVRVPADSPNTTAPTTTAPTTPSPNVPPPQIPTPTPPPAPPSATKVIVSEKLFRIELAPLPPCKPATACEATLVVHSLEGYKVNAEYPTKFVAKPAPGVTVEGTGAFAVSSKTLGAMTVTFRAAQAGTARLTGAFKLSVCTEEICEIAAPAIAFDVAVFTP